MNVKKWYNYCGDIMQLKDVLDANEIFHPSVFYEGEWCLGGEPSFDCMESEIDYLLLNARKIKGKNAYEEFLIKNYFSPLANIVNSSSVAMSFYPKIVCTVDENNNQRVARFSISNFIMEMLLGTLDNKSAMKRFFEYVQDGTKEADWLLFVKEELRQDRKKYRDVALNSKKSIYYKEIYQVYLDYFNFSHNNNMTFQKMVEGKVSGLTKLIVGMKHFEHFFAKEIPYEELLAAFDYDVFCLLAARSALDGCRMTEQNKNMVDNSIDYVKRYLDAVEYLRKENKGYNCSMITRDKHSKKRKLVTIHDIQIEYEHLLARHPEFSFIEIRKDELSTLLRGQGLEDSKIESFDARSKDDQEILSKLLEKLRTDKELAAEWEFIPKGSNEETTLKGHMPGVNPTSPLKEDEKIRRMLIGKEYLENTNYVYKILGVNKFEGYVGYIYPNGAVVFEKYYENLTTRKVASSSATYVMNLYNFLELSKLSKQEIIHKIKEDSYLDVKRIFHRADMERWKSEVLQAITGNDYTDEVINYIKELIKHSELKKNGVKK